MSMPMPVIVIIIFIGQVRGVLPHRKGIFELIPFVLSFATLARWLRRLFLSETLTGTGLAALFELAHGIDKGLFERCPHLGLVHFQADHHQLGTAVAIVWVPAHQKLVDVARFLCKTRLKGHHIISYISHHLLHGSKVSM
jgi:hypothetical protein